MTVEEKKELVESWTKWWHKIDFGDGVVSNGPDYSAEKAELWQLDEELLKGKTVLDIGAWDGYFSFLAERLEAKKVTALDVDVKKGFMIARKILESNVEYVTKDIMDTTPENIGTFDVVLYPGVLYHMKFPYLSLHKVADLVKDGGRLFVETHTCQLPDHDNVGRPMPVMKFYPNKELNKDPTNWWGPNNTCVIQMLQTLGFRVEKVIQAGGDRMAYHATKVSKG
jgi:tRNA (mo5U34)-methyltransferase